MGNLIEKTKLFNDYIKHLNTLSTGAILILLSFNDKIGLLEEWKYLVAVSFIAFFCSIIGGVVFKTLITSSAFGNVKEENIPKLQIKIAHITVIMLWLGFLVGISSLAIFGAANFLNQSNEVKAESIVTTKNEPCELLSSKLDSISYELEKCDYMLRLTEENLPKLKKTN